jgi:hypothetical protein
MANSYHPLKDCVSGIEQIIHSIRATKKRVLALILGG